jgi:hypothetical protein
MLNTKVILSEMQERDKDGGIRVRMHGVQRLLRQEHAWWHVCLAIMVGAASKGARNER